MVYVVEFTKEEYEACASTLALKAKEIQAWIASSKVVARQQEHDRVVAVFKALEKAERKE